jgi:NAD(P)-dependent dehydrogenase (short-subunit alcohol dehydrogenase family)
MVMFNGKVALITGGGTGIGAAVAARFVEEGDQVVLMGRREAPLREAAAPLGGLVVAGDAADAASVRQALAQARQRSGGIDVLVAMQAGMASAASSRPMTTAGRCQRD